MSIDATIGLRYVEVIASVGVVVSSLELLARPRLVDDASLMSWPVFRLRHPWFATGASGAAISRVLGFPRILGIIALRLVAALLLVAVPTGGPVHVLLLGLVALGTSMLILRTTFGLDGADQLVLITFTTLALVAVYPDAVAARLGLWFIALQACLAYFTAGIYKVTSRTWWDGSALTGVLGTLSYGNRSLARWFDSHRRTALWCSRLFCASEAAFPLVLLCPASWLPYFLAWGVVFHASCAVIMGLNDFVWAFVATYPAIAYVVLR
jgi:hypothetical protein